MTPTQAIAALARSDPRGAIWVVAQIARRELGRLPAGSAAERAISLAEAYAAGQQPLSAEELQQLSAELNASEIDDDNVAALVVDAAHAAVVGTSADYVCGTVVEELCSIAAQPAYDLDGPNYGDAAYDRAEIDALVAIVHHTTPNDPFPEEISAARPEAQVAWDWLHEQGLIAPYSLRYGRLSDALARAVDLGLRWECPVERAIAERCGKHQIGRLRAVLGGEK